ncbi:MAG TPA: phosphate ABC transporter substrate-binding protein [Nodosilinea sp.]|nr:phosphate ABC transporter substrate-binding protein [Nodosilinea sp.]
MVKRGFSLLSIGLALSVGLHACSSPSESAAGDGALQGKVVLTGSSTVAPLVAEVGKRFEAEHPGVRIDVQTGGSSRGVADARQGTADIGMISRDLKADEQDLQAVAIALDGIGIIVHQDNPVQALSRTQLEAIYTGQVESWAEVGGNDAPITVVNKAEGRATLEVFLAYLGLGNDKIQADVIIGDNQQGIQTVAGNADAIGYVSIGAAEATRATGAAIQLIQIDGIEAKVQTVKDGTFPLARPLQLVTVDQPNELTQAFLDFAQSPQVNDIIQQQDFIPVSDSQ